MVLVHNQPVPVFYMRPGVAVKCMCKRKFSTLRCISDLMGLFSCNIIAMKTFLSFRIPGILSFRSFSDVVSLLQYFSFLYFVNCFFDPLHPFSHVVLRFTFVWPDLFFFFRWANFCFVSFLKSFNSTWNPLSSFVISLSISLEDSSIAVCLFSLGKPQHRLISYSKCLN